MGSKSVPITNPTVLQGGLEAEGFGVDPLIPPRFGALRCRNRRSRCPAA